MVVMHAVAIYYLDGQEFYVGYVTQEIRKQQQEQQIYVMIVGIDFNEEKYTKKNMGMVYAFGE
jgi:hypothetical protein